MRILGFSKKWNKLEEEEFTTFRFCRRDRDWEVGEVVQVVYKPRRKGGGEHLGIAEIVKKEPRRIFKTSSLYHIPIVTKREAIKDGFMGWGDMALWLTKAHGHQRVVDEPMNKLTLRRVKENSDVGKQGIIF